MLDVITTTLASYPTNLLTVLLGVLLIYWVLALFGLLDLDALDVDLDADPSELGQIASYVVAFGLTGVPFSVVISLVVLIAWLLCYLADRYLLFWMPGWMTLLAGTVVLIVALAAAVFVTARALRPMRGLFVEHNARGNASLVGLSCQITTLKVDERFGQANVETEGTAIAIRVRAAAPNGLVKGSVATIVSYDEGSGCYEVVESPLI